MESKTFVIGDIHGAYHALVQCLERCGFRKEIDTLITLGDICDGWPYVCECVEELLKLKTINLKGNHDHWFWYWLKYGKHPDAWLQGGQGTVKSYIRAIDKEWESLRVDEVWYGFDAVNKKLHPNDIPDTHKQFFHDQKLYYKDLKKRLFVHGGFYRFEPLHTQAERNPDVFYWDRELWDEALSVHKGEKLKFTEDFSEIFIGHTTTLFWTKFKKIPGSHVVLPVNNDDCPPMHADIIWNLDTGAGSSGKLTIMDIDTHEYWQSDLVNTFYGEYKPRR